MKHFKIIIILIITATILPSVVYANMVWPALYVANSHFHFWFVVLIGLLLEAALLRWKLIENTKKALKVSIIVNTFSATIGILLLAFGMLGWHLIFDSFIGGTFAILNKIISIVLMMIGSTLLEMLIAQLIWKFKLRQTLPIFIIGNLLSYTVIAIDLFILDGWNSNF